MSVAKLYKKKQELMRVLSQEPKEENHQRSFQMGMKENLLEKQLIRSFRSLINSYRN